MGRAATMAVTPSHAIVMRTPAEAEQPSLGADKLECTST